MPAGLGSELLLHRHALCQCATSDAPCHLVKGSSYKELRHRKQLWCALVPAAIEIKLVGWLKHCTLWENLTIHNIQNQRDVR